LGTARKGRAFAVNDPIRSKSALAALFLTLDRFGLYRDAVKMTPEANAMKPRAAHIPPWQPATKKSDAAVADCPRGSISSPDRDARAVLAS